MRGRMDMAMKRHVALSAAIVFCAAAMQHNTQTRGASGNPAGSPTEPNGVTIALTRLDVNDTVLELQYAIRNACYHDIWVCGGVGYAGGPYPDSPECTRRDRQTLVIRQRTEVSSSLVAISTPAPWSYVGRFVRLGPGQQRTESLSLRLPARHQTLFTDFDGVGDGSAKAVRLALEIGYFHGDLPGTIDTVLALVDLLQCANLVFTDIGYENAETFLLYFRGLNLQDAFEVLSDFDTSWKQGKDEILIPYQWPAPIMGERCLRVSIDGIRIPYEEH